MSKRCFAAGCALVLVASCEPESAPTEQGEQGGVEDRNSQQSAELRLSELPLATGENGALELPFAEVIEQVTGKRILPVTDSDAVTTEMLNAIEKAADGVIRGMNQPGSPVKNLRRINEASRLFEDALMQQFDAIEGIEASIPRNAAGNRQRSGYPDIRLLHTATGRIFYLDPKLYEITSESSSLRTFYFTPKSSTNKVLEDACHLLLGIAHDGNDGNWRFLSWKVVDLARLKVRLKLEFQASNKDLYAPAVIRTSKPVAD